MFFVWFTGLISVAAGSNISATSVSSFPTIIASSASTTGLLSTIANSQESTTFSTYNTITPSTLYRGETETNTTTATAKVTVNTTVRPTEEATTHTAVRTALLSATKPTKRVTPVVTITATTTTTTATTTTTTATTATTTATKTTFTTTRPDSFGSSSQITSSLAATSSSETATIATPSKTPTTETCSDILLGLNKEQLRYMVFGAFGVAALSIVLVVVVCCCCACQVKKARKQLLITREAGTISNPYCNADGRPPVAFPSPLQLETFLKTERESPYDMPDQTEASEVSYVSVINDEDTAEDTVETPYTAPSSDDIPSKQNGSLDPDTPVPPLYSNASTFFAVTDDSNPYEELRSKEREKDPQYASLINRKEKTEKEMEV